MKNINNYLTKALLLIPILYGWSMVNAQEIQTISVGSSYSEMTFYNLETSVSEDQQMLANDDWDIAIHINSPTGGISINEAKNISFTSDPKFLVMYKAPTNDFDADITIESLTDTLTNDEIDWNYGALNSVRDINNPSDFGWGVSVAGSSTIDASTVYVIKTKLGFYRKFKIDYMIGSTYTLTIANLDGGGLETVVLNSNEYHGSSLILHSFDYGISEKLEPWHLLFSRYTTWLEADSVLVPYDVAGLLLGPGIKAAKATNIDPETVDFSGYSGLVTSEMRTIGHEFKYFDLNNGWEILANEAYFVQLPNDRVYKLVFLDFEGSSSGILTLEKTDLGIVSTDDIAIENDKLNIYPNPSVSNQPISIVFDSSKKIEDVNLVVSDMSGKVVVRKNITINHGLNGIELNTSSMNKGNYIININHKDASMSKIITIQ